MKIVQLIAIIFCCINVTTAQSILGKWKTIDNETGKEKSIVKIYEKDGKIYGQVIKLLNPKVENPVCHKCSGDKKNKPILGMHIIEDLSKKDNTYEGGTILNPENGKQYKCSLKLDDDPNKLLVRGYVSFFHKTQYWVRVE